MPNRLRLLWLVLAVPVIEAAIVVGGTYVYIHAIKGDEPARLTLERPTDTAGTDPTGSGPVTAVAVTGSVDGTWTATSASKAGYRVKEVLFGQDTEAVGRTDAVTGSLQISGTTVGTASFAVDMTKVSSDQANRDRQFSGRIMDVSTFPTATFALTRPITLASIPSDSSVTTVSATGDLTLKGKTRPVTFDLSARRNGATIEVNGTIPVAFADFGIGNPSFGPAKVGDTGEVEFLLVFAQ